jgi:hypothetical protein
MPERLGDPEIGNNRCGLRRRVAYTSFVISRSLNFWIFPVFVLGGSANAT